MKHPHYKNKLRQSKREREEECTGCLAIHTKNANSSNSAKFSTICRVSNFFFMQFLELCHFSNMFTLQKFPSSLCSQFPTHICQRINKDMSLHTFIRPTVSSRMTSSWVKLGRFWGLSLQQLLMMFLNRPLGRSVTGCVLPWPTRQITHSAGRCLQGCSRDINSYTTVLQRLIGKRKMMASSFFCIK